MKRLMVVFLSAQLLNLSSNAQQVVLHPSGLKQAIYHDVSPPLREMQMLKPGSNGMRWENGEIPNNFLPVWKKQNQFAGTDIDPVVQDKMGCRAPLSTIANFDGIAGTAGYTPPDENGDVGLDYYIETVNISFAIYTKTGDLAYGPANLSTLWQGFPGYHGSDGDPIVLYDHLAGRWLISQFSLPNYPNGPYYELFAISQSEDPLGSWNRYSYEFSNMPDYPKLGVWPDGYYLSANSFTAGALNWCGPLAAVLERDSMLTGAPARMVFFQQAPYEESMIPADLDGPAPPAGTPGYFAMLHNQLRLYQLHANWVNIDSTTFTGPFNMIPAPYDDGVNFIPQKGTTRRLDVLPKYLMHRLQYRNFGTHQTLVANHTVDPEGTYQAGVRWYEIRKSTGDWAIYQQGTYAPDTLCRWMASVAMDGDGNIALGYSVSGDTIFPSIGITGRRAGDSLGQMTFMEDMVINGSGAQTGSERWGDYSSLNVDPADDHTFWYVNEYYPTTSQYNWSTRIASFTIDNLPVTIDEHPVADSKNQNLLNSFPNPFTSTTSVKWKLTEPGFVSVRIFNLTGENITHLADDYQKAGEHSAEFDASGLPAGVYFCQLVTGKTIKTQKMILIR
ncbi:MAG: T9SS type A sorting domain-containing protein [Bacteroidota bacterium]